jgi:hypothetical protein
MELLNELKDTNVKIVAITSENETKDETNEYPQKSKK